MNMTFNSFDLLSASSVVTCLSSTSSVSGEFGGMRGGRDGPLIVEVSLVPHEYDDHVVPTLRTNVVDPFRSVHERAPVYPLSSAHRPQSSEWLRTGDIVDDNCDGRVSNVGGDEGPEPLLSRGVPELEPDRPVLEVHRLAQEVNPWVRSLGIEREARMGTTHR